MFPPLIFGGDDGGVATLCNKYVVVSEPAGMKISGAVFARAKPRGVGVESPKVARELIDYALEPRRGVSFVAVIKEVAESTELLYLATFYLIGDELSF